MQVDSSRLSAVLLVVALGLACQRSPRSDMGAPEFRNAVGAGDWERYELAGDQLVLSGASGPVARFTRRTP